MRKFVQAIVATMALVFASLPSAHAATIMVSDVEMGTPPDVVTLTGGVVVNQAVYLGPVTFTLSDMSKLLLYCIDMDHEITLGPQAPMLSYHTAPLASYLSSFSATTQQQIASLVMTGLSMPYGTGMNPVQGGIWQKLGGTVTTGNAGLQAQINAYGSSPTLGNLNNVIAYVSDDGHQTFVGLVPTVPEPASWALMLVGFGAIGSTLRRSRAYHSRTALA